MMATDPTKANEIFDALLTEEQNQPKQNQSQRSNKRDNKQKRFNENTEMKRTPRSREEYTSPDSSDDVDEQIEIIAESLRNKIEDGNILSAVMFAREWIDGIVDGRGQIYEPVRMALVSSPKDDLVDFIGGLLSSIR